ncbi:ATP-binding protein [Pseudomonas plecoglossicida]|uniref:ATP-binding protein n=1 Tax=Pseudomonas plecoglossicida TaxID=70775 RepID=UPI0015E48727|nr:ATP-binding protein [Pseudomonas plecoglossicida]MBA1196030.1 ATP-binding protein [Pseudomonas plecoglossicida]
MLFKSTQPYKGFYLEDVLEIDTEVAVLTGKNGAGKTRFLEAVRGVVQVFDGERLVPSASITYIPSTTMQGRLSNNYAPNDHRSIMTMVVNWFNSQKDSFAAPYRNEHYDHMNPGAPYNYEQMHKCFESIARKLGKSVRELTDEEIKFNFEGASQIFDGLDIGGICNEYMRRKRDNLFEKWRAENYEGKALYVELPEFIKYFGEPPWLLFNEVLGEIFDGKIGIDAPSDETADDIFIPVLKDVGNGQDIPLDGLSSGEKSLLWLATVMFKLKYRSGLTTGVPELILLDEPDAFLHPKMVVKFYSVIQRIADSFRCQVIFTTHSPTTVALAPDGCVYRVASNSVVITEKDEAIADLLDGVTQISLSSRNRREVFVESKGDVDAYRYIYDRVKSRFPGVDSKISLSFLVAGPKMPPMQVEAKVGQYLKGVEKEELQRFTEELNGVGDCGQVIAMVESLTYAGNSTVRGLIDWDLKNKPAQNIVVAGFGVYYTIENIMLNPLYILRLLYGHSPLKYPLSRYCGVDVSVREWMDDIELLQSSIDAFILEFTGSPNAQDAGVELLGGHVLKLDSGYLRRNGHGLMGRVVDSYRELKSFNGREGGVLFALVKSMVDDFGWEFVPACFDNTFSSLQR